MEVAKSKYCEDEFLDIYDFNLLVDTTYVQPVNYDSATGQYALYNKYGQKVLESGSVFDTKDNFTQAIEENIAPYTMSDVSSNATVSGNYETLAEKRAQDKVTEAENEATKVNNTTQPNQYDSYSTPISDELNQTIQNLQPSVNSSSENLDATPGGDADYLAESVVAYDKAKTEIDETYSDDSIAERAQSQGVTDIEAYTEDQQNNKAAELQKLDEYYSSDMGSNIYEQALALNGYFNGDYNSSDAATEQIGDSIVGMEKELSSIYSQFKSESNVDYSTQSVESIAQQFESYSSGKVQSTVTISGTDFTYNDLVSASKVLSMSKVDGDETNGGYATLQAAFGVSEVGYVAKNDMSTGAGSLLTEAYGSHLQNQIAGNTVQSDSVLSNATISKIYNSLQWLDVSDSENFKSDFQNVMAMMTANSQNVGETGTCDKLQSSFDKFASAFL